MQSVNAIDLPVQNSASQETAFVLMPSNINQPKALQDGLKIDIALSTRDSTLKYP